MKDVQNNRLSELSGKANRTEGEEKVRLALVELKSVAVVLDAAKAANPENAVTPENPANPSNPVDAGDNAKETVSAQKEFDKAQEAYYVAEEKNGTPANRKAL